MFLFFVFFNRNIEDHHYAKRFISTVVKKKVNTHLAATNVTSGDPWPLHGGAGWTGPNVCGGKKIK